MLNVAEIAPDLRVLFSYVFKKLIYPVPNLTTSKQYDRVLLL